MKTEEITHQINQDRLKHKGGWYAGSIHCPELIEYKGYGAWLQIFRIAGIDYAPPMGLGVRAFKGYIEQSITEHRGISS